METDPNGNPIPTDWFSDSTSTNASERLLVERARILDLFNPGIRRKVILPTSSWDRQDFTLVTHDLYLSRKIPSLIKRVDTSNPNYTLAWYAKFSMLGNPEICKNKNKWKMLVFYPRDFDKGEKINVAIGYLPKHNSYGISGVDHFFGELKLNFGEGKFFWPCYYDHTKKPPMNNAYNHAFQALLWLRARLYADHRFQESMQYYD